MVACIGCQYGANKPLLCLLTRSHCLAVRAGEASLCPPGCPHLDITKFSHFAAHLIAQPRTRLLNDRKRQRRRYHIAQAHYDLQQFEIDLGEASFRRFGEEQFF